MQIMDFLGKLMDFIIETPFKVLLNVFDSFLSFLKDKKEEMY